jgi:3-hydroxyacyl-CoA dehydrogenase/enoyl-CoA hydratase/3-hydroxybutyryl-CoA epimerase
MSTASATQPWDRKDAGRSGGAQSPLRGDVTQFFMGAVPEATRRTLRNYPAPVAILSCVYEGSQLPLDRGLDIEHQQFALLASKPEARNLIRTMFINKGKADKLGRRPAGIGQKPVTKVAVLGAGMMGAGLAHVLARAGCSVAVLDRTPELAQRAVNYAERQLQKAQAAGKLDAAAATDTLARVKPTADYADLAGSEFVIEAVFENRAVKAEAIARSEAVIDRDAVFATNTSTLPVTGLAAASSAGPRTRPPWLGPWTSRVGSERRRSWSTTAGASSRAVCSAPIAMKDRCC